MLLEQERFESDVLGSAEPVLVDFYKTTCPPCRQLMATIDRLAGEGYAVSKVNVEDRPELAVRYRVSAVPTLVIVKGGAEVARFVGVQGEAALRAALDRAKAGAA